VIDPCGCPDNVRVTCGPVWHGPGQALKTSSQTASIIRARDITRDGCTGRAASGRPCSRHRPCQGRDRLDRQVHAWVIRLPKRAQLRELMTSPLRFFMESGILRAATGTTVRIQRGLVFGTSVLRPGLPALSMLGAALRARTGRGACKARGLNSVRYCSSV